MYYHGALYRFKAKRYWMLRHSAGMSPYRAYMLAFLGVYESKGKTYRYTIADGYSLENEDE